MQRGRIGGKWGTDWCEQPAMLLTGTMEGFSPQGVLIQILRQQESVTTKGWC